MRDVDYLVKALADGMEVHTRQNGKVHRVHGGGTTVGEIVVGDQTVRLNLKRPPEDGLVAQVEELRPQGRSRTWKGGGIKVTEENVTEVHKLLASMVSQAAYESTRLRNIREAIGIIQRAKKDGFFDERIERDLRRLLDEEKRAVAAA